MDPGTLTAILLTTISLTKNIFELIKKLYEINDPKVTVIRTSLLTQNRRTKGWFQRMDEIKSREELRKCVTDEDLQLVQEFTRDIKHISERAEYKFGKIAPKIDQKLSFSNLTAKWRWIDGGYEDLRLLVKALKELNNALYEFTDLPPRYQSTYTGPPRPVTASERGSVDNDSSSISWEPDEESLDSIARCLTRPAPRRLESARDENDEPETIATESIDPKPLPRVVEMRKPTCDIYRKCMRGLYFIAAELRQEKDWVVLIERLKIWGIGLLKGPYMLDDLFAKIANGRKIYEDIRIATVGCFADIALLEVQLLGWLSTKREDRDRERVQNVRDDVYAILGSEEILDIALERPDPISDNWPQERYSDHVRNYLLIAIKSLFELLPAIRSIRRAKILEEEELLESQKAKTVAMPMLTAGTRIQQQVQAKISLKKEPITVPEKARGQYSSYLLDKALDDASNYANILEEDEARRAQEGIKIENAYSKLVLKERERLQSWRVEMKRRDPQRWSNQGELKARDILKGISANMDKGALSASSEASDPALHPKAILERFSASNSKLWNLAESQAISLV